MVPVIRVDEEIFRYLQAKAIPLVDTPNEVLRRILKLDEKQVPSQANLMEPYEADSEEGSIFIVVNAAGNKPNELNARAGKELTEQRIRSGVDIQARRRFSRARNVLKPNTRIVMHQGGALYWRSRYGSGQLIAAGVVKAVGLPLTSEDIQTEDYKLTKKWYESKPLTGKALYEFPKGLAGQPLPKEAVHYEPGRGDNLIEVHPNHPGYVVLDVWWRQNV